MSEERTYALDLCVVELVANIVDHGYRGNAGEIHLELDVGRMGAVFTVRDGAPAFDPLSVPPPATPASLEDAQVGGRGIQMVRAVTDGCRYERRDGQNVFTAYFGLRSPSPAPR